MVWAGYLLMARLPFEPVSVEVMGDPLRKYGLDLWRCAQVVLPAALLWGASFPLALAAIARPTQDPGRLVGGLYAANTLGAIAGAIGIGLFLVAELGSQRTQQVLILLSVLAGVLMLMPARGVRPEIAPGGAGREAVAAPRAGARPATDRLARGRRAWPPALPAIAVAIAAIAGAVWLPAVPGLLVAFGRFAPTWVGRSEITYVGEGLNAFVAVSRSPTGALAYHNSGKVQAGSEGSDMRLQRMLGHLSHLVPAQPKDVLVIGLGAGVTAGAVAIAPSVDRVTIVEIEPLVPQSVAAHFGDYNYHVVGDPKVTMHIDDGRHWLLTTDRTFDVITSDPLDPWIKGAATLFTEEFFQTMRRHLNPGGVVTQFVQLYGSNSEAVKSEIGTFVKVFPHTLVFGNLAEGQGYDLVLVGRVEPMTIDVDALQARLDDPAYARVAASLREIGITSVVDLLGNYAGSADDLQPWLEGATINTDRNLRLQYLAGLTLNAYEGGEIYLEMLEYTRFPERVFRGSHGVVRQLRERIAARSSDGP
jgi:spermidine synthase